MTAPASPGREDGQFGLFVYGTLLPGQERWRFLKPFVYSDGIECAVVGDLYDTGFGYPAAIFDHDPRYVGGTIRGRLFQLEPGRYDEALELLDMVEGAVAGMYHRVLISFDTETSAWAYQVGDMAPLTPIPDGDWPTWARIAPGSAGASNMR